MNTRSAVDVVDRSIRCRDCGGPFTFTAEEQRWFERLHWRAPFRCPSCRRTHSCVVRRDGIGRTTQAEAAVRQICILCEAAFDVSVGEQQFLIDTFGEKASLPRRCRSCRQRARHGALNGVMNAH
jgi:hypothetical protein